MTTVKTRKLHELIAIEKSTKERVEAEITKVRGALQHPDFFNGHQKKYQPKDEMGERYPDDIKRVQVRMGEVLDIIAELQKQTIDNEATKDLTNTVAKADIILDGKTIASGVPATTLLFLEKELEKLAILIQAFPVLDAAQEWKKDDVAGLHKTEAQQTHRTAKVQKPIVLFPATAEHPAQTQLITEDQVVGYWNTIQVSGSMPLNDKMALWKRVCKMNDAVKAARGRANSVECQELKLGEAVFNYLFEIKAPF